MLQIIKNLLLKIVSDIDAGNSNISDKEALTIMECLRNYTIKEEKLSKYSACKYLNISRATFDNYVKEGKLPKGNKILGFKELVWYRKDLDSFIKKEKNK